MSRSPGVERDGDAVLLVQGRFAVALGVVVLDVVVDERGLVEGFDGDGGELEASGWVRDPRAGPGRRRR
jgi:hypothetical protein